jgi:GNAT superfamily N-acetyltransferase
MENIQYLRATRANIQLIVDFRIVFSDEIVGKQDTEKESALRESLCAYFEKAINQEYICWYAMVNNEPVAIAGMGIRTQPGNVKNPSGKWGYIMSVYTKPEHRKKGLSANILNKLIETGREMGITAFELHATKAGEPVYIKNGFKQHNEPTYRKFIA